jgi:formyltetrahydrofolate-dependent phosphoribosylglycinamide formyltransferase
MEPRGAAWRTVLLVSDRDDAGALDRARLAGVETRVIAVKGRSPEDVERETLEALRGAGVEVIFLAGYLRLVPPGVVRAFRRRILNIHPALLPSFGGKGMYGMHVHRAVLGAGVRVTGPTVHFVDERYDEGTVVAQWPVPVLPDDTPETLQARVLAAEHRIYPLAADHLARCVTEGREPGALELAGGAFTLVQGPGGVGLDELVRHRFPPDSGTPNP